MTLRAPLAGVGLSAGRERVAARGGVAQGQAVKLDDVGRPMRGMHRRSATAHCAGLRRHGLGCVGAHLSACAAYELLPAGRLGEEIGQIHARCFVARQAVAQCGARVDENAGIGPGIVDRRRSVSPCAAIGESRGGTAGEQQDAESGAHAANGSDLLAGAKLNTRAGGE